MMPILAIHSICLAVTKEDALLPPMDAYIWAEQYGLDKSLKGGLGSVALN